MLLSVHELAMPTVPTSEPMTPSAVTKPAEYGGSGGPDHLPWWRNVTHWQWIVLAAGVLIRLRAFLQNPSLWGDESAVALNLLSRDFWQLTLKLDDHQGAPLGFLWLSKASIELFGVHEYSLRLVPLVAGLLALPLALMLIRKCFQGWPTVLAMLMVSGSSPLIYFCAELKQYSLDVACTLLMVLLALSTVAPKASVRQYATLAVLGSVLTWFSHSLILVLAGIGSTLGVRAIWSRQWRECLALVVVGTSWLASYALQYVLLLRYHADDSHLMTYWAANFLPWPVEFESTFGWLWRIVYDEASYLTPDPLTWISIPLIALGAVSLSRREGTLCAMLLAPLAFGVLAAALHRFPLAQRLWLFAVPSGFILLIEGVRAVVDWPPLANRAALLFKFALVAAISAPAAYGFYKFTFQPPKKFAFREALEFYSLRERPDDPLYVEVSHDGMVEVYGRMRRFAFLKERPLTFGEGKIRSRSEIEAALRPFAGQRRVWLLATKDEATIDALKAFVNEPGRRIDGRVWEGSAVFLIDLSAPTQ